MTSPRQPGRHSTAMRDLALVATLVIGYFLLAAHWDLSERFAQMMRVYEPWQLDEVPLTLLVLSLGLCWFALRRAHEARRALIERIRAEAKIADLLSLNRELSQRLILVQENERRTLARELHDEFGQSCTAIRAEASYIVHAGARDAEGVDASARRIDTTAEHLYGLVRDMLVRLHPPTLESLGLESTLQELCESWEAQTGIACGFFPHHVSSPVDASTSVAVYRLIQEALTNVARHADASQVRIELHPAADARSLELCIEDDGRGIPDIDTPRAGFGLMGMRERVAALGGDIDFRNLPQRGLQIHARLPLPAGAP